jgi:hypothetical protein
MNNKKANGEAASNSFVLRGYVRHWLNNVWAEYDRVRLTDILDPKDAPAVATPSVAAPPVAPPPADAPPAAAAPKEAAAKPRQAAKVPEPS